MLVTSAATKLPKRTIWQGTSDQFTIKSRPWLVANAISDLRTNMFWQDTLEPFTTRYGILHAFSATIGHPEKRS